MPAHIFIVGPHRAGSTLWHNLIAISPGILRLAEPRFLGAPRQEDFRYFLNTRIGDLRDDNNVDEMVNLLFSRQFTPGLGGALWKWKGIELVDDPRVREAVANSIKNSDRSLGAIARGLVDELTRWSGDARACVKFPVDIRHIPQLMQWFPEGRIVHITRDPRGLAMSKSNDPSGTAPLVQRHPYLGWPIRKAALGFVVSQYRFSARVHRSLQGKSNYQLFSYEDLLAAPRDTLQKLCQFVGIEFIEDMLAPERGRHEHQPSSLTGKQQKAFDGEAAVRWRRVMSPLDNFLVTWSTRASMRKLGYDPGTHPIFREQNISPGAGVYCQSLSGR